MVRSTTNDHKSVDQATLSFTLQKPSLYRRVARWKPLSKENYPKFGLHFAQLILGTQHGRRCSCHQTSVTFGLQKYDSVKDWETYYSYQENDQTKIQGKLYRKTSLNGPGLNCIISNISFHSLTFCQCFNWCNKDCRYISLSVCS